jgi:hypothetical protein
MGHQVSIVYGPGQWFLRPLDLPPTAVVIRNNFVALLDEAGGGSAAFEKRCALRR